MVELELLVLDELLDDELLDDELLDDELLLDELVDVLLVEELEVPGGPGSVGELELSLQPDEKATRATTARAPDHLKMLAKRVMRNPPDVQRLGFTAHRERLAIAG